MGGRGSYSGKSTSSQANSSVNMSKQSEHLGKMGYNELKARQGIRN